MKTKPSAFATLTFVCLYYAVVHTAAAELSVNETRVYYELMTLATFNDLKRPEVQRILYTEADVEARKYITALLDKAGLSVHNDAVGNIFGVWKGATSQAAVVTGSHIDAIPHSGMYDGTLGVIGAIEAIRALKRSKFQPERDIIILAFTSEEPTRFGLSCIGSRLLSGAIASKDIQSLVDNLGIDFDQARVKAGYTGDLDSVRLNDKEYSAFVELHIEQAPTLQDEAISIGAVTAIAAPAAAKVEFTGGGGHAGSLLMPYRNDAGLAASECALEIEAAALATGSNDTVATTGKFEVFPGAVNSVPRVSKLGIDVRDIDLDRRNNVLAVIQRKVGEIASRRNVTSKFEIINADDPATCSKDIVKAILEASHAAGLKAKKMVSRAYHDALFMARKVPTGMIFVPCHDGISHRPEEYVEPEDIKNGVFILAKVLAHLAGKSSFEKDDL